jgi:hypothetical protein
MSSGTSGGGSTAASGSADQNIDKAVQAYRDCLQK